MGTLALLLNAVAVAIGVAILWKVHHMSAQMDALEAQVAANSTVEQSAVVLLRNLTQLIVDAGTDPVKLKAITDGLKAQTDDLAAAIVANTPQAPPAGSQRRPTR